MSKRNAHHFPSFLLSNTRQTWTRSQDPHLLQNFLLWRKAQISGKLSVFQTISQTHSRGKHVSVRCCVFTSSPLKQKQQSTRRCKANSTPNAGRCCCLSPWYVTNWLSTGNDSRLGGRSLASCDPGHKMPATLWCLVYVGQTNCRDFQTWRFLGRARL